MSLPIVEHFKSGRPYIIAEVAQSHEGSLGMAHAFIDAAKACGADAVKFQTHIAEEESSYLEPWRVKFSQQDESRYDYWKRMEFTPEQWAGLKEHCDNAGITFMSSPFSIQAVELLERLGMETYKIASGELSNKPMMDTIYQLGKPVIISSGMSRLQEVDELVAELKKNNLPHAVLQCTTAYPTPAEKVGLNNITLFRERYLCPVGLSDHSGMPYAGLAAVALGANIVEVHLALSKNMFGPDVVASLDPEQLKQLCEGAAFIYTAQQNHINKDTFAATMTPLRDIFTKSIVSRSALAKGHTLTLEDLAFKKPGTGMPAAEYLNIIGKRLATDIEAGHFLDEGDLID